MRNYNCAPEHKMGKDKINKDQMLKCLLTFCNKKYRTEKKRQQHVEKNHFYETIRSNSVKFSNTIRAQIYDLASTYIETLYEITENKQYGESSAKNLLPQLYGTEVNQIELERIITTQATFAERLLKENLFLCDWDSVMNDLECFFQMGLPYYDTNFCPTLPIDFLWHALMQNPNLYVDICNQFVSQIIPHCNNDRSLDEDAKRHIYFLDIFQHQFKKFPYTMPQNDTAYQVSCLDMKKVFVNFRNKELEKEAEFLCIKEEMIKEKECLKEEMEKERERLREERNTLIKEISENVGVDFAKCSYTESEYYLCGYKQGLREALLKNYVEKENERHKEYLNSDEYKRWMGKC